MSVSGSMLISLEWTTVSSYRVHLSARSPGQNQSAQLCARVLWLQKPNSGSPIALPTSGPMSLKHATSLSSATPVRNPSFCSGWLCLMNIQCPRAVRDAEGLVRERAQPGTRLPSMSPPNLICELWDAGLIL